MGKNIVICSDGTVEAGPDLVLDVAELIWAPIAD